MSGLGQGETALCGLECVASVVQRGACSKSIEFSSSQSLRGVERFRVYHEEAQLL